MLTLLTGLCDDNRLLYISFRTGVVLSEFTDFDTFKDFFMPHFSYNFSILFTLKLPKYEFR